MEQNAASLEKKIKILQDKLKSAEAEVQNLITFQEESYFPMLRIGTDGTILYSNVAALPIMREWKCKINQRVPDHLFSQYPQIFRPEDSTSYLRIEFKHFAVGFVVVPIKEMGYINLYGYEIDTIKRLEIKLLEQEKQYRLLIENSSAILLRWKFENQWSVEFISDNISQFGFLAGDFISKNIFYLDIIHPDDKERIIQEVHEYRNIGLARYSQEYRIITKEGAVCWVEDRTTVEINAENNERYHQGVMINITARKNSELAVKAKNKELKKLNFELDRFVYSASHDLKAPLRSMMGLIDLANREKNTPTQKNYLDKMSKSVNKLDNFITDLINFSRNSRLPAKNHKIDFKSIIIGVLDNLKYMENTQKITVYTNIKDKTPFYSDPNRIGILFSNLISNAIKYQNLESNMQPYLDISISVTNKNVLIEIKDNGVGIAKENLKKIFRMFYRASEHSQGSGLGLYIVKEIIKKLKGSIVVDSQLCKGTNFSITVPNTKNS